jgi:1-acyl-sn-glycerol-3-phosphate acyltransferase
MVKSICSFIFKILGWKITGKLPDLKKFIIIVAPHTSSWDFPLGVLAREIIDRDIRYLGKKELFKPPFGWIFRALGGYPVDRQQSQSTVDRVVEIFYEQESFLLALAPEGTRSQVTEWRTGFYHMAVKSGVPIQMIGMDYSRKAIEILELFYPCGDIERDIPIIRDSFSKFRGKNS